MFNDSSRSYSKKRNSLLSGILLIALAINLFSGFFGYSVVYAEPEGGDPTMYTLTVNLDGGEWVNPDDGNLYAEREFPENFEYYLDVLDEAVKRDGYSLVGWQYATGGSIDYPFYITSDIEITAVWTPLYKVTLNLDGGNWTSDAYKSEFEVRTYEEGMELYPGIPYDAVRKDGYEFSHWEHEDGSRFEEPCFVTGNMVITAVWKPLYKVTVNLDGGEWASQDDRDSYAVREFPEGYEFYIDVPSEVVKRDGFLLIDWQLGDGSPINYPYYITSDIEFKAVWERVYTVTINPGEGAWKEGYSSDDGIIYVPQDNAADFYRNLVSMPYRDYLFRDGYSFSSWVDGDNNPIDWGYVLSGDITIYPVWKPAFKVTMNLNGGEWVDGASQETHGVFFEAARDDYSTDHNILRNVDYVHKEGYNILHWIDQDKKKIDHYYQIEKDITISPIWAKVDRFKITIDPNGGVWKEDYPADEYGSFYFAPEIGSLLNELREYERMLKNGDFAILNWVTADGKLIDPWYRVDQDMIAKPIWIKGYKVRFETNGGNWVSEEAHIEYNSLDPLIDLTYILHCVEDLMENGNKYIVYFVDHKGVAIDDHYVLQYDTTVKPIWSDGYTLTVDSNTGVWLEEESESTWKEQLLKPGTEIYDFLYSILVGELTKEGHTISHWVDENGQTILRDTALDRNMTVKPVWQRMFTIDIDPNGGSFANDEQEERYGSAVYPENYRIQRLLRDCEGGDCLLVKKGRAVVGWVDENDQPIAFGQLLSRNMTIKPVWGDGYKVTVDLNGGSFAEGSLQELCLKEGTDYRYLVEDYISVIPPAGLTFFGWLDSNDKPMEWRQLYDDVVIKPNFVGNITVNVDCGDAPGAKWVSDSAKEAYSKVTIPRGGYPWGIEELIIRPGYELLGFEDDEGKQLYYMEYPKIYKDGATIRPVWYKKVTLTYKPNTQDGGRWKNRSIERDFAQVITTYDGRMDDDPEFRFINIYPDKAIKGWQDESGRRVYWFTSFKKDTVIMPIWGNGYNLTFDLAGGVSATEFSFKVNHFLAEGTNIVDFANKLTAGGVLEKKGFCIDGWIDADTNEMIDHMATLNRDLTIKPNWVPSVTIDFDLNGGSYSFLLDHSFVSEYPKGKPFPLQFGRDFYYPDHKFIGLKIAPSYSSVYRAYDPSEPIYEDCSIRALWEPVEYQASFFDTYLQLDGTYVNLNILERAFQMRPIVEIELNPDRVEEGYAVRSYSITFFLGQHIVVPSRPIEVYLPLAGLNPDYVELFHEDMGQPVPFRISEDGNYAIFMSDDFSEYFLVNPLITVSYDTSGGTEIPTETILKGSAVAPEAPKKSGYAFVGWELPDGTPYDGTPLLSDVTLKAAWGYEITIDPDDGTPLQSLLVKEGDTPKLPTLTREGFVFDKWLLSDQTAYVAEPITGNLVLKASWVKVTTPSSGEQDSTIPGDTDVKDDTVDDTKEDETSTAPKTGERISSSVLYFGIMLIIGAMLMLLSARLAKEER